MDIETYLEQTYEEIDSRHPHPIAQDELKGDITYCRAVWSMAEWIHKDAWNDLQNDLSLFRPSASIFTTRSDSLSLDDGELHVTLFQLQTFSQDPQSMSDEDHKRDAVIIQRILSMYPSFHIKFRGITRTKHGLFLNGYPSIDMNVIREIIRKTIPDVLEPHPQNICHATLLRFHSPPTKEMIQHLDHLISKYKSIELTKAYLTRWEYGYGTWLQKKMDRIILHEWKSHPRWILHRGLSYGPNPTLENDEITLLSRIVEGWDVELDVWYINGDWWIGHDRPSSKLQHLELLTHPHCWVHCKNLEALYHIPETSHHFVHDRDVATLTSHNYIWYNINQFVDPIKESQRSSKPSVMVLPERSNFSKDMIWSADAVCSDYLPLHFL